jgi:hypothetical protein
MKNYIKQRLREDLEYHHVSDATKDEYTLNEDAITNDLRNEYIKLGLKTSFSNPNLAKRALENILYILNKLPQTITLYRVVFVSSIESIDTKHIGSHYVLSDKDLSSSHSQKSHVGGGEPVLLIVKSPKNLIDVDATIRNRMEFPNEKEITLKNRGLGAKIISKTPFLSSDSEEDLIGLPDDDFDFGYDDDF